MEVNNLNTNRRAQIGNITIPLLKGEQGYSISRIVRTSGDGGAGTTDTYTVYIDTDPETAIGTFQVVNGTGGDMSKSVYDIDNDDIVDRATGDGNGNEITATYETIENVTALASRVATLEQAGYITKSVADLANYYLKSETYTKQEVNNLCDMIPKFAIEVVSVLPTQDISETTIYLLRDDEETQDVYQEYIYVNNTWERIGGQRIDLSNYYQKSETYSKDELNGKLVSVGAEAPENGERVWFKKSKNLLNLTNGSYSSNGVTAVVSNGIITLNGTASANVILRLTSDEYTLHIGSFTLSANNPQTLGATDYLRFVNSSGSQLKDPVILNQANAFKSFDVDTETTGAYLQIRITSGTTLTNYVIKPMLEEGSTATTYEPYVEEGIYVDEEELYSKPKVLWTNPAPTESFAGQTITLSEDISNYSHYEILYFHSSSINTDIYSTGKIPKDKRTRLFVPVNTIGYRIVSLSGASASIQNYVKYATYGESTTTYANNSAIPYQILGYKE